MTFRDEPPMRGRENRSFSIEINSKTTDEPAMRPQITSDEGAMRVPLHFSPHKNCRDFGCFREKKRIRPLPMADVPTAGNPDTMDTLVDAETIPGEPAVLQDQAGCGSKFKFRLETATVIKNTMGIYGNQTVSSYIH